MKQHRRLITLAALVASSVVFLPHMPASAATPSSVADRVNRIRTILAENSYSQTSAALNSHDSQELAWNYNQNESQSQYENQNQSQYQQRRQSWNNASNAKRWNNWNNWQNWKNWNNWGNASHGNNWNNAWHNSWSNY